MRQRPQAEPFPHDMQDVWHHYVKLDRRRTSNGWGVNPLSYSDVVAYSQATDSPLDPWEVDAIMAVDDEYMQARAEAAKK